MPIYRFLERTTSSVLIDIEACDEKEAWKLLADGGGKEVDESEAVDYETDYVLQEIIKEV